jgi:hypothetical protein
MLLAAIFIILGVGIIAKKQIKISAKRTLSGQKVLNLGILFMVTGAFNVLSLITESSGLDVFTFLLDIISVLTILYLTIFSKGDHTTVPSTKA